MPQQISEMYRGFQILIEAIPGEDRGVKLHRRISRWLDKRLVVEREYSATLSHAARASGNAMTDALRDAREAVDRLLGGWHPAYVRDKQN